MQDEYLTLTEAAERTGISRVTLWRMVKGGKLPVYASPRDRRAKLIKWAEMEELLRPVPLGEEATAEGKAAA
jgi:excisionase family DNA binding protein